MLIDIDNHLQSLVHIAYPVYSDCFYFYYDTEPFTPLSPEIRFVCHFKQAPLNPYDKPEYKQPVKIAGQCMLSEGEIRNLDEWIAIGGYLGHIYEFLNHKISSLLDKVEENNNGLLGYVFDREITKAFNDRTRYLIHKKR